jgi:hypothetical protein
MGSLVGKYGTRKTKTEHRSTLVASAADRVRFVGWRKDRAALLKAAAVPRASLVAMNALI